MFTEFACRSGGSNLNAGTRTGNSTEPGTSASFTYASGNWVASTGVFTVASGNPSTDGIVAGDFASVYPDGSSVAVFIGRVTASSSTTITVSLSAKSGTAPTDGTGNRTLKIGGAWLGPTGATAFPFAFVQSTMTNVSGEQVRVNFKNDATYSITAAITHNNLGPTFQGYTTAYGDGGRATLDGGTSGVSYTLLTHSTFGLIKDFIFQNNGATGSAAGTSLSCDVERCVFTAFRGSGSVNNMGRLRECEAYGCNQSNTATAGGFFAAGRDAHYVRCISHDNTGGNSTGFTVSASSSICLTDCIADTNGAFGLLITGSGACATVTGFDAYSNGSDGINIGNGGATNHMVQIENANLVKNGAYGIRGNSTGSLTGTIQNVAFGAGTQTNTSGTTTGLKGINETGSINYASNVTPWVDPANGDFRINLSTAKGTGRGTFTQTATSYAGSISYPDVGSNQHADAGGGGGRILSSSIIQGIR